MWTGLVSPHLRIPLPFGGNVPLEMTALRYNAEIFIPFQEGLPRTFMETVGFPQNDDVRPPYRLDRPPHSLPTRSIEPGLPARRGKRGNLDLSL